MECQFPKQTASLESIFEFVSELANRHCVSADITRDMQFAIEEIFTNMVRYNTETQNDVTIDADVADGVFRVTLADRDVHSFDPTQRPPVDTERPPHERTPGGLGIHLVRQMMDDVRYEYVDRTARITLIKRLET